MYSGRSTVFPGPLAVKLLNLGSSLGPIHLIPLHHPVLMRPLATAMFYGQEAGIYPLAHCDLRQVLLDRPDGVGEAMAAVIVKQIASAMRDLHAVSVALRDLTPENVLVQFSGAVAIADFGVSCPAFKDEQEHLVPNMYACEGDYEHRLWCGVFPPTFDLRWLDVYAIGKFTLEIAYGSTAALMGGLPAGCDPQGAFAEFVSAACRPVASKRPLMAELLSLPFLSVVGDGPAFPLADYVAAAAAAAQPGDQPM